MFVLKFAVGCPLAFVVDPPPDERYVVEPNAPAAYFGLFAAPVCPGWVLKTAEPAGSVLYGSWRTKFPVEGS